MQDQLDRMEKKIDLLLAARHEHHGRLTNLESQAGTMKWVVGVVLAVLALVAKYWKGES